MVEFGQNTGPGNYVEVRSQVEQVQVVEKARDVCLPVGVRIVETCGKVNYLIDLTQIQSQKAQLKEEIEFNKPEFIEKLKQLPDYEGSKVKEAIEKGTIEIKKIPGKNLIGVSFSGKNLDIIFDTNGKEFFDFDWRRSDELRYAAYTGFIKGKFNEVQENGEFFISNTEKKYSGMSDQGLLIYYQVAEYINEANSFFENVIIEMKEEIEFNKPEFIEKLKQLPNYERTKVREAIEKGTIEIKKIPNRDIYAIYESKTGNLIYLTLLNGEQYNNVHHFRDKDLLGDMIYGGFIRQGYGKIELDIETGLRRLYKKDGKEVPIFSDEYATATLNAINYLRQSVREFEEEYEKRQKQKRR